MKRTNKVTVYTPDSDLRHPIKLCAEMARDIVAARGLAWRLFVRNISAKYRQTAIGYFWAILPPVLTSTIWIFLNSQKIFSVQQTDVPYPLYVLTGTIIWQVFAGSIQIPIQVVKESAVMLAKINFPREALFLAAFLEILFNTFIQLVLLTCVFIYFGVSLSISSVFAVSGLFTIIMMGMMIGIILTPFVVLYGDVQAGLPILLQPLFYLTPIVYPIPTSGIANMLAMWNPVSPVIQFTRELLITGQVVFLNSSVFIAGIVFVLLLVGWLVFRLAIPHLIERIAA